MLQARRDAEIVHRLRAEGASSVEDLSRGLGVSASTVRRDLARLDAAGALRRVRGGAAATDAGLDDPDVDHPYAEVLSTDTAGKRAVGARAAELVGDGDVVLLDIGTTVVHLAQRLRGRPVTVITSSLAVLDVLRDDETVDLVLLGGSVRTSYRSLVGLLTTTALEQVRADVAFLGTSGVQPGGDVLDNTQVEVPVKRALLAAADRRVLLADRHKFPGGGALKVCHLRDLDTLVTDVDPEEPVRSACADASVDLLTATGEA